MEAENPKFSIFPSKSPVSLLGDQPKPPATRSRKTLRDIAAEHHRKLTPLLRVKEEADKVYSNGYFEQHYKEADRLLKQLLHDKVMNAWAAALNDEKEEAEELPAISQGLKKNINSITINMGE